MYNFQFSACVFKAQTGIDINLSLEILKIYTNQLKMKMEHKCKSWYLKRKNQMAYSHSKGFMWHEYQLSVLYHYNYINNQ